MSREEKLNVETHFLIVVILATIFKLLLDKYRPLVETVINATCFLDQMCLPAIC